MASKGDPRKLNKFRQMALRLRAQRLPCWLCLVAMTSTTTHQATTLPLSLQITSSL